MAAANRSDDCRRACNRRRVSVSRADRPRADRTVRSNCRCRDHVADVCGSHVYPPHVIAILPVGAVLHFTYLATGNFAVPVVFHFLNNTLAAVQIRRGDAAAEDVPRLIAGFFACYVMLGLFWLSRSNSHLRQCRDNPHISNVEEMNVPRLPNLADRETAVSPVATICAILMLLLSAALFAK